MKNNGNENYEAFSIRLCSGGSAVLETEDRRFEVASGCLLISTLNRQPETVSSSDDYIERSVAVTLDMILDFPSPVDIDVINLAIRYPLLRLDDARALRMSDYFDLLDKQSACSDNTYRQEIYRSVLYALILEICDLFRSMETSSSDMPKPRQEALTDDFFKLLARHYRKEHTVGFYADRLNRTPKYLSSAIRKLSGRSVPEWIAINLIRESRNLLKTSDKTVLEISEELNFSSPSVFVQFFRHHTGVTPLQYRKRV